MNKFFFLKTFLFIGISISAMAQVPLPANSNTRAPSVKADSIVCGEIQENWSIGGEYLSKNAHVFNDKNTLIKFAKCYLSSLQFKNTDSKEYVIPNLFIDTTPELIYLIIYSKSIDTQQEKQSWFSLLPLMSNEQLERLYDILIREARQLLESKNKSDLNKYDVRNKYLQKWKKEGADASFENASLEDFLKKCFEINGLKSPDCAEIEVSYISADCMRIYEEENAKREARENNASSYDSTAIRKSIENQLKQMLYAYENYKKVLLDNRLLLQINITKHLDNISNIQFAALSILEDELKDINGQFALQQQYVEFLEKIYESDIKFDSDNIKGTLAYAYGNLCETYILLKDYDNAFLYAEKAHEKYPKGNFMKEQLGFCLLLNGAYSRALDTFNVIACINYRGGNKRKEGKKYSEIIIIDMEDYQKKGVTHPDFIKLKQDLYCYQEEMDSVKYTQQPKEFDCITIGNDYRKFLNKNRQYVKDRKSMNEVGNCFLYSESFKEISEKYNIPSGALENDPGLIYLVLNSKSMDTDEEKQKWFNSYPMMKEDQLDRLHSTLSRELTQFWKN